MKYTTGVPNSGPMAKPEIIIAMARQADRLGFDAVAASERLVMPRSIDSKYPYGETGSIPGVGTAQNPLELLSLMSFVAAQTSRIRLLTGVLVLPYRNPLIAAKTLATIDILSGGRLILGCGVGWMREEAVALGVTTPFEHRGTVTDEYIQGFREIWSSDTPEFHGKYLDFANIELAPKPVQKPSPPIWIGGESPAAIRRVARLADGWMPGGTNPRFPMGTLEQLADGISRLRRQTEAAGRDPASISVRFGGPTWDGAASAEQVADEVRKYAEIGVTHMSFGFAGELLTESLERMESFMAQVPPLVR